jgi:hypothetical protein
MACAHALAAVSDKPTSTTTTRRKANAALLFRRASIGYQSAERNLSGPAA